MTLSPVSNPLDNSRKRRRNLSEPPVEKRSKVNITEGQISGDSNPAKTNTSQNNAFELVNDENERPHIPMIDEGNNQSKDSDLEKGGEKLEVPLMDKNKSLEDNRGLLFELLFHDVVPVDFGFDGNTLHIIGSMDMAARITSKFKIMQKLAHLVGCGLDCHFRMAHNKFRLMMMVRGFPRTVFGTTVAVVPDLTNIRKFATPGQFIEAGQAIFFNTILLLIPRNLQAGQRILENSFLQGIEDRAIGKLYEFLKDIREATLTNVANIPFVWAYQDFPMTEEEDFDHSVHRNLMKECGEKHLQKLENERPGFLNRLCNEWGIGRTQTFAEIMEHRFNAFN